MTNAQLEHVVLVQARELEAQRRTITRQRERIRALERDAKDYKAAHRRGYQAGWSAGRREIEVAA